MARKTGSHAQITGPAIQKAALRLFARDGYAAVSMRQIAAEVGIQAGAIYNYTRDKQGLLFALLNDHMTDLLTARAAEPDHHDPVKQLEHFVRFHIGFHLERPDLVFVSYMELRSLSAENFQVISKQRGRYEQHLASILDDGHEAGVFDVPDPKVTSFAIIAMLTGVVQWFRDDGRLSEATLKDHYWTLSKQMVGVRDLT